MSAGPLQLSNRAEREAAPKQSRMSESPDPSRFRFRLIIIRVSKGEVSSVAYVSNRCQKLQGIIFSKQIFDE
jgi:hypothetical protein